MKILKDTEVLAICDTSFFILKTLLKVILIKIIIMLKR